MGSFTALAPQCPGAQGVLYDTALAACTTRPSCVTSGGCRSTGSPPPKPAPSSPAGRTATRREVHPHRRPDHHPRRRDRDHDLAVHPRRRRRHRHAHRHRQEQVHRTGPGPNPPQRRQGRRTAGTTTTGSPTTSAAAPSPSGSTATPMTRSAGSTGPRTSAPSPRATPTSPPSTARRNDAESINRALDDTMWLRRAHSIGHERQHLNLLTHALVVNSLALHRHRQRSQRPAAPPRRLRPAARSRRLQRARTRSQVPLRRPNGLSHRVDRPYDDRSKPERSRPGGFLPRFAPAPPE